MSLFQRKARCQLCRKGKVKGFTQLGDRRIALTFCSPCWDEIRSSRDSRGDARLVEELARELDMRDVKGREYATSKLSALRSPAAVEALGAHLLKHPHLWTLAGLAKIGDARARAYIHQTLCQQGLWWAKEKVEMTVSGDLVGQSSIEVEYRRVHFEKVQEALGRAPGSDNNQNVIRTLVDLLADPECQFRADAREELEDLLRRNPLLTKEPKRRDFLLTEARRLQQGDTTSQQVAAWIFKRCGAAR